MKKIKTNIAMLLITSITLFSSVNAVAKDLKVGVVDVQSVAQQLPQMAAIQQKVADEFKDQVEALKKLQADAKFNYDKLQREGMTLSAVQQEELKKTIIGQQKELEEKGKPLQQQMQRRGAEEQNKILALVEKAIQDEAKKSGYNMIFHKASIAFSDAEENDISDKVAERVKKIRM